MTNGVRPVPGYLAGDDCRLLELPGVDHFEVIDPRHDAWPAILDAVSSLVPARG